MGILELSLQIAEERGVEIGMSKGREQGIEQGVEKGVRKSQEQSILKLYRNLDVAAEKIAVALEIPLDTVVEVLRNNEKRTKNQTGKKESGKVRSD